MNSEMVPGMVSIDKDVIRNELVVFPEICHKQRMVLENVPINMPTLTFRKCFRNLNFPTSYTFRNCLCLHFSCNISAIITLYGIISK